MHGFITYSVTPVGWRASALVNIDIIDKDVACGAGGRWSGPSCLHGVRDHPPHCRLIEPYCCRGARGIGHMLAVEFIAYNAERRIFRSE